MISHTWFKEQRVFTRIIFLFHVQTILEMNNIFVQFHCLSLYQNNLYWNNRFPYLYSKIFSRELSSTSATL